MEGTEGAVGKVLLTIAPHNSCTLASQREEMEGREEGTKLGVKSAKGGEEMGTVMVDGVREEEEEERWKEEMMTETGMNPTDQ